jgi:hypothetical protein
MNKIIRIKGAHHGHGRLGIKCLAVIMLIVRTKKASSVNRKARLATACLCCIRCVSKVHW